MSAIVIVRRFSTRSEASRSIFEVHVRKLNPGFSEAPLKLLRFPKQSVWVRDYIATRKMIDQFINFVIRPPRADYNPDQYLWDKNFTLAGKTYQRKDLEASMDKYLLINNTDYQFINVQLRNGRGHILQCSHYLPSPFPEDTPLPCVIYCHGNSGCRADANEAALVLLPSNITVFTLDFSGSGLSGGDYVSLGWHESDDLKIVVSYLRNSKQVLCIGLWGRSMGAVTGLLYGAADPSISGMVLDSAFSNLFDLMMELVDVYKIRLPKFTTSMDQVKMAVQYMRRVILKKAKFDIMDLNCMQVAPKTFIPTLFGHANDDKFIQPHHSELIFKSYAGDKNIIKFDGDHNSSRPKFYYDSVSIFFDSVLHPPQVSSSSSSKVEKYYDLEDLKVNFSVEKSLFYGIMTGPHSVGTEAASSSHTFPGNLVTESVADLPSEIPAATTVPDSLDDRDNLVNADEHSHLQENFNCWNEEYCSHTSSDRESWGRCSSLGGTDEEPSSDCTGIVNSNQMTLKALAKPLRMIGGKSPNTFEEETKLRKKATKKLKRDKFEKLEALGQRLRLCILRVNHRRHHTS
ncbi:Serine aminopeptidase, S33 [Dillenia turbinata]|uniref:Serine aminopeptidase, S33 n=1 Tax=Dillenia turbinata TaxID=194707 RepID=A0AAN8UY73_9MAGN